MSSTRLLPALLAVVFTVAACSKPTPPPEPPKPAVNTQLLKEYDMYRQLLEQDAFELAGEIGKGIVERFPDSPQAAEVRETLADVQAKGAAASDEKRMARLWVYQTDGVESGGMQNTASIYSNEGGEGDRVRLILRRHSAWGLSVYLFGSGKGFVCKDVCALPATWDGKPQKIAAYLPETGEPALFIKDEKAFIAKMEKTRQITIDVQLKERGKRTITFDVGGYDPAKFPELPKRGKKK